MRTTGAGIVDSLLNHRPRLFRKFLKSHGNTPIKQMRICREPLPTLLTKIGNLLTAGELNKRIRKLGYDNVFHLYLLIELMDGRILKLEKNERVTTTFVKSYDVTKKTEYLDIKMVDSYTINDMVEGAENLGSLKYTYSLERNNCQQFLLLLLKGIDILTPEYRNFIYQNASEILNNNRVLIKGIRTATNIRGILNYVMNGGSNNSTYKISHLSN